MQPRGPHNSFLLESANEALSVMSKIIVAAILFCAISLTGRPQIVEGNVVPLDATDAEIKLHSSLIRDLDADPTSIARLFPTHYPESEKLYYPGFEVFVWDKGLTVTIGGIEDGQPLAPALAGAIPSSQ